MLDGQAHREHQPALPIHDLEVCALFHWKQRHLEYPLRHHALPVVDKQL